MENVRLQVMEALPNLPPETLMKVMTKLSDVGVESCADLVFLTEQDLCGVIRPVQARKLLTYVKENRDDIWSPEKYMLLLDGHVVATAPEFEVAFCMLFASYFSFHICYAQEVSSTLEFIQRELFGINPDRGSKAKKGRTQVNKRVLNLFQRITESQWNI
ncbi:uncharacterized protein ISCGN_023457 [Ixodes scapularis]